MNFTLKSPQVLYMENFYGTSGYLSLMNDTTELLYSPKVSLVFQLARIQLVLCC